MCKGISASGDFGCDLLLHGLFGGDGDILMLDLQPKPVEDAHVNVGHPDQGEPGDEVASPAQEEHLEAGDDEKEERDVVREAVLAGEEVKEFSPGQRLAALRLFLAELTRFAKDLFMRNGPRSAGDRDGQEQKKSELNVEWHHFRAGTRVLGCRGEAGRFITMLSLRSGGLPACRTDPTYRVPPTGRRRSVNFGMEWESKRMRSFGEVLWVAVDAS